MFNNFNFANSIKMEARHQKERAKRLSETAEQREIRLQRIKLGAVLASQGLSRCVMDCLLDGVTAASVFVRGYISTHGFGSIFHRCLTVRPYFSKATWLIPQLNARVNWANRDNVNL